MFGTALDNLISVFSPAWAARRAVYREQFSRVRATSSGRHAAMDKLLGTGKGGYAAGQTDRLRGYQSLSPHENDIPRKQLANLRWRAWNLHRNNPQARKACRTLGAKVIGRGLSPQPQATLPDGSPFVDFRRRARLIWGEFIKEADFRGKPGAGGQTFTTLSKTALRAVILSGGVLFRFRRLDANEQRRRGLFLPLQVQLLHVDRLDEQQHGGNLFYGIELDSDGRAVAYHVMRGGVAESSERSVRVPASEMRHLFSEEDIDQLQGAPWVAALMVTADDRQNYQFSELIAAEMGSCIVAGYRRSAGHTGQFGLSKNDERGLTDADGNPVSRLQPGMFLDLGSSGEIQMVNPNRPNNGAEGFISHMVRSEAVSMPGVKASTLTGDYRNSSFSSERSADNDVWPEIEELQDWFSNGFCQPVYEEVIATAVIAGKFDDIAGFSAADFNDRRRDYLTTNWQGPVPRSINPKDDADAALQRVRNTQSTPQIEAAKDGRDWRENIDGIAEFIAYAKERGVPDDIWQQALGIEQRDQALPDGGESGMSEQDQDDESAGATTTNRLRNSGFVSMNQA